MTSRLLVLLALITFNSYGQQGNIWYFGYGAGLDFNSGSPVALTDGVIMTDEGVATIADENGDLLFYTDGITVWNKNHLPMPNGTDLLGDPSSSQSGIIVPKPGSSTIYYVFTVDNEGLENGFRYSEVDMSLQGGLGDVNANKNILLQETVTEQVTAVLHQNGSDIWVVAHDNENSDFIAYLVTPSGIASAPVISTAGWALGTSYIDTIGYMKASPDGNRIATANEMSGSQLFDFDSATGVLSNAVSISTVSEEYGVEFSPSGNILYIGSLMGSITQYDLLAPDISASGIVVLEEFETAGALQLAPDGKIYQAKYMQSFLSVINNPDVLGMGCDAESNTIGLSGEIAMLGLPTFIQSFFVSGGIVVENLCLGDTTLFLFDTNAGPDSIEWDFGDGDTSSDPEAEHTYADEGTYHVTVTVEFDGNSSTFEKDITIVLPPVANTPGNITLCDDDSANLEEVFNLANNNADILGAQPVAGHTITYHASAADADTNTGALAANYTNTSNPQTIYARITNASGCYDVTSFTIEVKPYIPLNLPDELVICSPETLTAPAGFDAYLWSTGETTQSIEVSAPGLYTLTATNTYGDLECETYAEVDVTLLEANIADDLIVCDGNDDGSEVFNLAGQTATILGGQPAAEFTVTYHTSVANAGANTNPLPANFANTSNPQTIYARVTSNASGCFAVTTFSLDVITGLGLDIEDISLCPGTTGTLTAPAGFDSYLWSTDETTTSIEVDTPGVYTLTVTKTVGDVFCESTAEVTVTGLEMPAIETLEVTEWTQQSNTITVVMENTGNFVYSLDNVNFQESPVFTGLESGIYKVYVQNFNGSECGIAVQEVVLFSYPKFFTPNGDSINETWRIPLGYRDPSMMVYVYDRYGKLVSSFRGAAPGWDGTLNGKNLPATDYWFVIERQNGGEFKGHFSLVR